MPAGVRHLSYPDALSGDATFSTHGSRGAAVTQGLGLYDTSHAVFRPRNMSPEELEAGYAWCYERLFSHASIWHRRPADWRAVPPYLAMSYLYKRSNRLWHVLIRNQLTGPLWRPLVECTRRRHLHFRRRLADMPAQGVATSGAVVSAGV